MQTLRSIGTAASIFALGLTACAQHSPDELELAVQLQAETRYPPAPPALKDADKVDWRNAAQPPTDMNPNDPRSNFIRAQSLMAKLSNAVYNPQAEFDRQMNPHGLIGNRITSGGGKWAADAYVGASERLGMAFVAVRGTSNFADFLTDFLTAPATGAITGLPGTVHSGFALYQDALYTDVRNGVDVSCNPNLAPDQKVPLWVTGHSLGAAAASILAYRLQQDGCNVAGVALFGSPRPGLADFKAAYTYSLPNITQRWTTEKDPIYCLPPGGAWRHVGTENTLISGINVGTGDGESQCDSPEKMIGFIKSALITLDPFSYGSAHLTQALMDWLNGKFDLGWVCPSDFDWKTALSYAACRATDFGYGVASVYGNLQPADILTAAFTLSMLRFHQSERYVSGLQADFEDPVAEWVTVRVLIPNYLAPGLVMREEIYQGECEPTPLDEQNSFCDFDAPVGGVIRMTSSDYLSAQEPVCNRVQNPDGTQFECEVDVSGPLTLSVRSGMVM